MRPVPPRRTIGVTEPHRYGLPPFHALHAWAWKDNPVGAHEDWNPDVLCLTPDI